jgi:hypothetical protein
MPDGLAKSISALTRTNRKTRHAAPVVAYTVKEFCDAYRLSRAKLYEMWKHGKGPRYKRDGKWVIITVADAEQWAARDDEPPVS